MSTLLAIAPDVQTFPLFGLAPPSSSPYLVVVDMESPADRARLNPTVSQWNHLDRWNVLDLRTGLTAVAFPTEAQARAAMARILSDCPDRSILMDRGGRYIRETILPLFRATPNDPEPEDEPDEEPEDEPCDCCGETGDECHCEHCSRDSCGAAVESVCLNCERCEDCCRCETCSQCDERVNSTCSQCDHCSKCCECDHCEGCDRPCESTCPNCGECDRCCECHCCDNCGERHCSDDHCYDCGECDECCSCKGASEPDHWVDSKSFDRVTTRRYLSVEIEIAGTEDEDTSNTDRACGKHGVESVDDRSLEGFNTFELNTPPARGDAFATMVDEVCAGLRADGAKVNRSCGLHVHVDARDFDHRDIANLIRVYARIEDALFSLVSQSRQDNRFCGRCGKSLLRRLEACGSTADPDCLIARTVYNSSEPSTVKKAKKDKYRDDRYAALNLHSWVYRGTVECRLHQGTFDAEKIRNWAHLWGSILDWAKDKGVDDLPSDPWEALLVIAPTDEVRDWLRSRHAKFSS